MKDEWVVMSAFAILSVGLGSFCVGVQVFKIEICVCMG